MKFRLRIVKSTLEEGRREKDWIKGQPEDQRASWMEAEKLGVKLSDMAWIKARRGDLDIIDAARLVLKFREEDVQKKLKDNNFDTNLSRKNPNLIC